MKSKTNVLAALLAMMSASTAYAYKIDGGPEQGFYVVDIASSAPLLVADGFWGSERMTPQAYLDRRCPGGKVTEINLARIPGYGNNSTSVQIVFVMPANGCGQKQ